MTHHDNTPDNEVHHHDDSDAATAAAQPGDDGIVHPVDHGTDTDGEDAVPASTSSHDGLGPAGEQGREGHGDGYVAADHGEH